MRMMPNMKIFFRYQDEDLMCHHTRYDCPNPEEFKMHAHDKLEIYMFVSGDAKYVVEGNLYDLHPSDLLLMRNSEAHKLQLLSNQPYEGIAIHFSPAVFRSLDPHGVLLNPFYSRPLGRFNRFQPSDFSSDYWRRCLIRVIDTDAAASDQRIHLLSHLLPLLQEIGLAFNLRKNTPMPEQIDDRSALLIEYVNQNLFSPISLKQISQRFYISQSQLNRIFKAATGSSVWDYILIKRLLSARERIQSGEKIGRVSRACGFNDYSSFYRAYKTHFHHSPKSDFAIEMKS